MSARDDSSRSRSLPTSIFYFYQVKRQVERNALRANLAARAEDWPFGSLWIRQHGTPADRKLLSAWPERCPRNWVQYVNEPEADLTALRRSAVRGSLCGGPDWVAQTAKQMGLESTLRLPGRPRKL